METREWKTIDKSGRSLVRGTTSPIRFNGGTRQPECRAWPSDNQSPGTGAGMLDTQGRPAYGIEYDQVDVDIHGGLTFSDYCRGRIGRHSRSVTYPVQASQIIFTGSASIAIIGTIELQDTKHG